MVLKVMTSNRAVSEAVKMIKPQVIPVYPITPQTTISEYLAEYIANGELDSEYIKVESEHSAISASVAASAAGARVFTATSSQGLMLMHEILFAAAGMRTPLVLADANRAISAPLNIWNDQQDSIAQRDAGWLQIYVENAQDALDTTIMAYKIAEHKDVLLPCMVCLDGFILTHTVEPADIPEQSQVDKFLPKYEATHSYLDPERPMSLGTFIDPEFYMEARYQMQVAMDNSMKVIEDVQKEFKEVFGREYDFIEEYRTDDAEIVLMGMGSICGTLKDMVDELREEGEKIGLVQIRVYRPFPSERIAKAVEGKKVAVLDKNISFGIGGALYSDIKTKIPNVEAYDFIVGLGGKDIRPSNIREIVEKTKNPTKDVTWIGIEEVE